jgi:hypothetical protein
MKVFIAALVLVGLCVLAMCVGIFFHKGFPKTDIDQNEELRKRGISCYKHEDARLQREANGGGGIECTGTYSEACEGCALFDRNNFKKQ